MVESSATDENFRDGSNASQDASPGNGPFHQSRRQELEHRLKLSPTDRNAFLELARIYRQEQSPQQAARILKQAHELFHQDEEVLWEWEEAQLARSIQLLSEARDLVAKVRNPEADQLLEKAETDWANTRLRICRARLQRHPDKHHLRLVVGEALYDREEYEQAIDELQPLAAVESHLPTAMLWLGRCHLQLGRDVEAMRCLRAAGMRRAVVGPPKVRTSALRLLCDLAERHGFDASLQEYRRVLQTVNEASDQAGVSSDQVSVGQTGDTESAATPSESTVATSILSSPPKTD